MASLEKGGERYWIFLEDWSEAFPILIDKGLIDGDESVGELGARRAALTDEFGCHGWGVISPRGRGDEKGSFSMSGSGVGSAG
jgi:hypothetical protein